MPPDQHGRDFRQAQAADWMEALQADQQSSAEAGASVTSMLGWTTVL
jgi:hypothetical protein